MLHPLTDRFYQGLARAGESLPQLASSRLSTLLVKVQCKNRSTLAQYEEVPLLV